MTDGRDSKPTDGKTLGRIKTGKFERRVSMMKAGLFAGARLAGRSATNWFSGSEGKSERQSQILSEEAERFVTTLGELKGSVVKIGQMMALWGEHYLPEEVTKALHQLEDTTAPVAWDVIRASLEQHLCADTLDELDIDPVPIGAASLGQVHRAIRKSDGQELCLKIQYPGIKEAIETDLDAVFTLLKLGRIIPKTDEFELWFDEIRHLLRREVDYTLEAVTTKAFAQRLQGDSRFRVPQVFDEYSTNGVLCLSYERGVPIGSKQVRELSQARRDAIGTACLDICWLEIFEWGEMQTDPNFGNYLIHLQEDQTELNPNQHQAPQDKLVLLDFGAVRAFEPDILRAGRQLVIGSLDRDGEGIATALRRIGFYTSKTPPRVIQKFLNLCYLAIEPFADHEKHPPEIPSLVKDGRYSWGESQLSTRALLQAKDNLFTTYFSIPPKDFMYFSRKLIGTFTLLSVLDAKLDGYSIIKPHIDRFQGRG